MTREYSQEPEWYAIKVFFNKVFMLEAILDGMGLESYLAVEKVQLKGQEHIAAARRVASGEADSSLVKEGPVIFQRKPLVSSLIFVKATESEILKIDATLKENQTSSKPMGFIYKNADYSAFARIPASQMQMFKLITTSGSGLLFFSEEGLTRYKEGSRVRVVSGPLKGTEGYIKRIRRDRRLLVCIEGIIAVASSYIPPADLETVEE